MADRPRALPLNIMQQTDPIEMPGIPQYVPLTRVAKRLGVNTRTLRNWQAHGIKGCPRAIQLGDRQFSFIVDEIEAWVAERARQARESSAS